MINRTTSYRKHILTNHKCSLTCNKSTR